MPFDPKISNIEAEALRLWIEITEVNPLARSWNLGDIDIRRANREMKEAQKLDPTRVTTLMLLQAYLGWFLKDKEISLSAVVDNRKKWMDKLRQIDELYALLERTEVATEVEGFQKQLIAASKKYGWHTKALANTVSSIEQLAFIRRDALLAIDKLSEHQFLKGKFETASPKYNPHVYEFWNVNTLLDLTVRHEESGISLCLIRDPRGLFSYFAFVIRNGGNLYVLTDQPDEKYPNQRYMTRRPERNLEKRAFAFRFPYQLLDIPLNPMRKKQPDGLVVYQKDATQLKQIAQLDPDEVLWTMMMFDLIQERYWKQKHQLKQLSYTGEMITHPTCLLGTAKALVPVQRYRELVVPTLKTKTVSENAHKAKWENDRTGVHEWMERRYSDKVETKTLNRIEKHELCPGDRQHMALDPRSFGTKTTLKANAQWIARYNQAVAVNKLAKAEFKRRKNTIKKWYQKHVEANADSLLKAITSGKFMAPSWVYKFEGPGFDEHGNTRVPKANILRVAMRERTLVEGRWGEMKGTYDNAITIGSHFQQVVLVGPWDQHKGRWHCFVRKDVLASVHAEFEPITAQAVARLAGVKFSDLPDVIKHWSKHQPYTGNEILNNVDPMEWVPENPWRELNFCVGVALCKRTFNAIKRDLKVS